MAERELKSKDKVAVTKRDRILSLKPRNEEPHDLKNTKAEYIDEIVDIVNPNDEVIGQKPKNECHLKGILHRNISILIFKDLSQDEVLIQKRSKYKRNKPLKWNLTSGHVSSGETREEGAKRELQEEMFYGVPFPDLKLVELFKFEKSGDNDHEIVSMHSTIYNGEFSIDPRESEGYKYIHMDELIKDIEINPQDYTDTCRLSIQEYKKRILDK